MSKLLINKVIDNIFNALAKQVVRKLANKVHNSPSSKAKSFNAVRCNYEYARWEQSDKTFMHLIESQDKERFLLYQGDSNPENLDLKFITFLHKESVWGVLFYYLVDLAKYHENLANNVRKTASESLIKIERAKKDVL